MSKQDRQGVRTPADIEIKYGLGRKSNNQSSNESQDLKLSQLTQTLQQHMANSTAKFNEVATELDSMKKMSFSNYDSDGNGQIDKADDTDKFGGQLPEYYAKAEDIPDVPDAVSAFTNDAGYLTGESDPSVPSWAKEPTKPVYTAAEVGADSSGTASSVVSAHNTDTTAHNDLRLLIEGLTSRLNALADSDDTTLDQMSVIVAYIKSNKDLIDGITTNKVNISDIIDNLTTNVSNKPLSASQGVVLKALIDGIVIPTKVSELENDKGFLTQHQDLSSYAKKTELPTSLPANGGNADTVDGYHVRKTTDVNDEGQTGHITFIV